MSDTKFAAAGAKAAPDMSCLEGAVPRRGRRIGDGYVRCYALPSEEFSTYLIRLSTVHTHTSKHSPGFIRTTFALFSRSTDASCKESQ